MHCTGTAKRTSRASERKKKWRGNASRCYKYIYRAIAVVRCFVNNVSSTRYPFPLSLLRDANWTRPFRGNNSSEGTFMRAGARLLSSPFLPLRDFFRVASPLPPPSSGALHARTLWKMFYRADLSRPLDSPMRNDPPRYILSPPLSSFTDLFGVRHFLERV